MISKSTFIVTVFESGDALTSTPISPTLGSKFRIVVRIISSTIITDDPAKLSKSISRMFEPKFELKNLSVGIVSTKFLTDLTIARSFMSTGRSFVIGCGENDRLISLNA